MIGEYFITPHAIRQFRERIRDLPYDDVLAIILKGLQNNALPARTSENGISKYIRVRAKNPGEYDFRAVVKDGVCVTILRSGKGSHAKFKSSFRNGRDGSLQRQIRANAS